MQIELSATGGTLVMRLGGHFDFSTRNDFMARAEEAIARAETPEIRVDMGGLDYIDSSALGMLLMMRDKARKLDKSVSLAGAHGHVRQVIDTAQFERLFTVY
ncbi:MAG: STAS domain-containing protein [Pseudomonadota bacterium]